MSKSYQKSKGRSTSPGQFVGIPIVVLDHEDFRNLSNSAKIALIAILREFNGKNNGDLSLPLSRARQWGIKSSATLVESIRELESVNLIIRTRDPSLMRFALRGQCSLFAVTWRPIDECGGKHDYLPTAAAPRKFSLEKLLK